MTTYRVMLSGDIPAGLNLCRVNGWNQLPRDWEWFLHQSPQGCRVAVNDHGKVIGTAATTRYDQFSWIGMMLVDPLHQRQGIGKQLLLNAIDGLKGQATIRLDATPAGRHVYTKFGFRDEYELARMHGVSPSAPKASSAVKPMQATDVADLIDLDREAFGSDRRAMLEWQRAGAPELAHIIRQDGKIVAYCMGRAGHLFTHIGPIIAMSENLAAEVAAAALANCSGPVILDVNSESGFKKWLLKNGFTEMRQLIRMQRGSAFSVEKQDQQFAILGPEFG